MKEKAQVVGDLLLIFSTSSLAISYLKKGKSHNSTSEIKKFTLTSVLLLFSYDIYSKIKKHMHFGNMIFIYKLKKLMKNIISFFMITPIFLLLPRDVRLEFLFISSALLSVLL